MRWTERGGTIAVARGCGGARSQSRGERGQPAVAHGRGRHGGAVAALARAWSRRRKGLGQQKKSRWLWLNEDPKRDRIGNGGRVLMPHEIH